MATPIPFTLNAPHITLDALLKATGMAGSGGHAKTLIAAGEVQVNGEPELRRGRKLKGGERIDVLGQALLIEAAPS